MFPVYIETDRLVLEPTHQCMSPKDVYEYCSDEYEYIEELTEKIQWNKHENIRESMKVLSSQKQDWNEAETAHYRIKHKEEDEFVGMCSLDLEHQNNRAEIGVWLRKEYWGRSISEERALALIQVGFEFLELSSIYTKVYIDNEKSKKAVGKYMKKIGGRKYGVNPDKHLFEDGSVGDSVMFAVKRDKYESQEVIQELKWT